MQIRISPSGFKTGTIGEIHFDGTFTGSIISDSTNSLIFLFTRYSRGIGILRYGCITGLTDSSIGIVTTTFFILGKEKIALTCASAPIRRTPTDLAVSFPNTF